MTDVSDLPSELDASLAPAVSQSEVLQSQTDWEQTKEEKEEDKDEEQLAHEYRGRQSGRVKWIVLLACLLPSWMSNYYSLFSPGYLEHSLLDSLDISGGQFSQIVAMSFFGAIFSPVLVPLLLRRSSLIRHSLLRCLLLFDIILFISQLTWYLVLCSVNTNKGITSFQMTALYLTRILTGISVGCCDSLVQSTVIYWFGASEHAGISFGILINGLELGTAFGRVVLPWIKNSSHSISLPFLTSVMITLMASFSTLSVIMFVRRWLHNSPLPEYVLKYAPEYDGSIMNQMSKNKKKKEQRTEQSILLLNNSDPLNDSTTVIFNQSTSESTPQSSDSSSMTTTNSSTVSELWSTIRNFPIRIQTVILYCALSNVVINLVYSVLTEPMVSLFHFSERSSDLLWSISSFSTIFFSIPLGRLSDYYGEKNRINYLRLSVFFNFIWLLSFLIICIANTKIEVILGVALFSAAVPLAGGIQFTILGIESPVRDADLISAVCTCLWWLMSVLVALIFGYLRNWLHSGWRPSLWFLTLCVFLPNFLSVLLLYFRTQV